VKVQHLARRIGAFLERALLAILYFVFALPFVGFVRLFADPLRIKNPPAEWLDRPDEVFDIRSARKP
jgi:hypothetical protein